MSSPQTRICICQNLGLSNAYQHTFWFDNVEEQAEFFESKVIKTFVNYTYVRKNWSLKLGATVAEAEKWGYLFFQNFPTGRYYYYFITDVKYISDDTVELELEMDVLQTYFFDYALQPSFVEREHSATDTIGDNTIEEGLELGQHIVANMSFPDVFADMTIMIMSTVDLTSDGFPNVYGGLFDGVYSGCNVYRANNVFELGQVLRNLEEKIDAIVSIWMYPEALVKPYNPEATITQVMSSQLSAGSHTANRPTKFDGYTPKNNKLFTYPYCYLYASNNLGNSAIYRFERFGDPYDEGLEYAFEIRGSLYPDGGVKVIPKNYNGAGYNHDEAISFVGFPTCAWVSDTYKVWLAQNQSQHTTQGLVSVGAMVAGGAMMASGNVVGGGAAFVGGLTSIMGMIAQREDMERQPPQSRGATSATLNASAGGLGVTFYAKTITAERAKVIDDFFTMYGYKTLRVKTPNRNVRESFTYTKTVGCLLTGSLCQEDARKIQSIYDNGVTFWQKSVAIGNYSASNAVK